MRPGQITVNEFERAILDRIAARYPSVLPLIRAPHVLSREFTGAGSFTTFKPSPQPLDLSDGHYSSDDLLLVPGVPSGLGATLHIRAAEPPCLEIYTYGTELWDGTFNGFRVEPAA